MSERLWERVQEALDQGRDPFEDDAIRECLLDEPEAAAGIDRMAAALERLPARRRPAHPMRPAWGAAAALLVVAASCWLLAPRATPPAEAPTAGRVLFYRVRVTRTGPLGESTRVISSEGISTTLLLDSGRGPAIPDSNPRSQDR